MGLTVACTVAPAPPGCGKHPAPRDQELLDFSLPAPTWTEGQSLHGGVGAGKQAEMVSCRAQAHLQRQFSLVVGL